LADKIEARTAGFTDINRVIALWGFTEAALGGILHAVRFPFTGLFISCAAVTYIILIDYLTGSKIEILRATLIVILIKAMVNPYAQFAAYLAVALQGLMGYLFFSTIRFKRGASLLLGLCSLLFSALQKLIFLTLVFGMSFWKSIDLFAAFVLSQFPMFAKVNTISFSILLISIYTGIHVIAGIYVGIKAPGFPGWLRSKSESLDKTAIEWNNDSELFLGKKTKSKRGWWRKKSGILFLIFTIGLLILSYIFPQLGKNIIYDIIFMLIRSILIMTVWFGILSPVAMRYFKRFVEKKSSKHALEIERITRLFPKFRLAVNYCWRNSAQSSGLKRFKKFFSDSLVILLLTKMGEE